MAQGRASFGSRHAPWRGHWRRARNSAHPHGGRASERYGRSPRPTSRLMIREELRYFMAAIQLLTRLPVPHAEGFTSEWMERGVKYFPLAGALVGAFCALILLAASHLWNGALPALLTVAAGIAITGGLHEDGFADFFDGMGGATRDARLAIMKDSRAGTYGVLALVLGVGMKVLALAALPPAAGAAALVSAHAGGRLAAVAVIAKLPYAGGLSAAKIKPLGYGIRWTDIGIAGVSGI